MRRRTEDAGDLGAEALAGLKRALAALRAGASRDHPEVESARVELWINNVFASGTDLESVIADVIERKTWQ